MDTAGTDSFDEKVPSINKLSHDLHLTLSKTENNEIDEVSFNTDSENFCVSVIDIIGSTDLVSTISNSENIRYFYSIFINTMTNVIRIHQGKVIKTVGDGIISYFPQTADPTNIIGFRNVLECCFSQIKEHCHINTMLWEQKLPPITYRISADYGKVVKAHHHGDSSSEDLFGSTVNLCSKINLLAPPNGIVIGNDLHRMIRSFPALHSVYHFDEARGYHAGVGKYSYPLYLLSRKDVSCTSLESIDRTFGKIVKYVDEGIAKISRIPRILLIDDELDDLFVLEEFLTLEGFEVRSFSSSQEALSHYSQLDPSHYDLVISDIRMPGINGLELYRKLKAIKHDIKVIFATCLEIAEELLTLMPELNHDQLIKKPIEKKQFIDIVKKTIQ